MSYLFSVKFTGDYFTLNTCVTADDEDQAIRNAEQLLLEHHGINTNAIGAWSVEAEEDGAWA
jgi:hypothetical protein